MKRGTLLLVVAIVFAFGLGACARVLGLRKRDASHPFEHRAHAVAGVNCLQCHEGVASAGDDGPLHVPVPSKCVECHARPHDTRACDGCHGESHVRGGAELAKRHLRFEHGKHVPELGGDCVRCHSAIGEEAPAALLPTMATCFGCHRHSDQWKTRDCDACHVDLPGEHVPPSSHVVHDGDIVREHGVRAAAARDLCATCHSERFCAGCHGVATVPALPARLAFDSVRLQGLHRAGFELRHADEARAQPGLCTSCHSESSCQTCHEKSGVAATSPGARSPHDRGWLTPAGGEHGIRARLDPASCAGCHGGAGERLCIGCHRVGGPGGNPHGPGFSSTRDKTHDLPCRQCHAGAP